MYFIKVSFACTLFYVVTFQAEAASLNSTEKTNSNSSSTEEDNLDDRFNLNFSYGQASGISKYGGVSQSNSLAYGVNAGIRGPAGQYQNIFSKTGAQGNSYSSGHGAPLTFANAGSRVQPGRVGGQAGAGIVGGHGSSFATSQNQQFEIDLGGGNTLLSNLKERNSTKASPSTEPSSTKASTESSSSKLSNKTIEPDALVFA